MHLQNTRFIQSANYIRAFASLAVAQFHLGGKALPILNLGWLGVEMFFVLSGFIICWSIPINYDYKNTGKFLLKRIIRIEPPYIISISLVLLISYLNNQLDLIDWKNVLMHLGYLNPFFDKPFLSPVYWTLGIEFQFYILIAISFPLIIRGYGNWLILGLAALSFFCKFDGKTIISYFPLFAIGIFSYKLKEKLIQKSNFYISIFILSALSIFTVGLLPTITALITSFLLFADLPKNKVIDELAKISFSLYLTHDIIGATFIHNFKLLIPNTILFKGLTFIIALLLAILFSYLFFNFVEKPFLKLSKKTYYKIYPLSTADN